MRASEMLKWFEIDMERLGRSEPTATGEGVRAMLTQMVRIEAALLLLAEGQGVGPARAVKRILEGEE